MVPLLLLLILLVIAWPVFAIFGGSVVLLAGSHLNIIIPTILIGLAYLAFLAPIAKRNNIKLGGKMGEPLDPSKPIGPEFQQMTPEDDANLPANISFFNPDQWKRVSTRPASGTSHGARTGRSKSVPRRAIVLAVVAFVLFAPLTVMVLDAFKRNALSQATFPTALTAIPTQADGSTGQWQITHTVDPMSDAEAVRFTLLANTSVGTSPVSLMVECSAKKTSVGIDWNDYLGSEQAGPYLLKEVAMRLGSGRPETKGWVTSPDQTATWAGQPTTELVFGLMQNAKVAAQVTPYNSSPKTASFDTSGLQALIEANKAVCGVINAATVKSNNPSLIPSRTLTGWVNWDGESGSINGQSQSVHFDQSTRGRNILFAGCEIKTTVSVPCKVTFIAEGDQIINFISAGGY